MPRSLISLAVISCCTLVSPPAVAQLVLYDEISSTRDLDKVTTFSPEERITLILYAHDEDFDSDPLNFSRLEIPLTAADDDRTFVWTDHEAPHLNWFAPEFHSFAVDVHRPLRLWVLNEDEIEAACAGEPDEAGCIYLLRNEVVEAGLRPTITEINYMVSHTCYAGELVEPCEGMPSTQIHTTIDMFPADNGRTAVALDVAIYKHFVPEPSSATCTFIALIAVVSRRRVRRAACLPTRRTRLANSASARRAAAS
jgi:hypothetical protein